MGEKQGHTPGPWVADEAENEWAVGDADGRIVAYLHQDDIDLLSEREANAHLIAAAPDLLKALKAADEALAQVTAFEDDARYIMGNTNFGIVQARRLQIKDAISCATGEDSPATGDPDAQ